MDKTDLLFKRCRCKAYLARVSDGRYIEHIEPDKAEDNKDHFLLITGQEDREYFESECCGENDLEKMYYRRKEKDFTGIVVGFKDVVTEGYLGVDYVKPYYESPFYRVFKEPKTIVECAIVYFAKNRSRYVPVDDIDCPELECNRNEYIAVSPLEIGNRIRFERKKLGLTIGKLAEKVNVCLQTLSKWENGIGCGPTVFEIVALCNVFKCDMTDLICTKVEKEGTTA